VVSWSFYPVVFVFPMIGFTGGTAATAVQVGYTVADIVAKAVFGVVIFAIAVRKSEQEPVAQPA
jgi:bacteriorhodopsin